MFELPSVTQLERLLAHTLHYNVLIVELSNASDGL